MDKQSELGNFKSNWSGNRAVYDSPRVVFIRSLRFLSCVSSNEG